MIGSLSVTAATLKTVLYFTNPENTPKIAYDKDEYTQPLIDKIKLALGNRDGTEVVSIHFSHNDKELSRQFFGVVGNIKELFSFVHKMND